MQPHTSIPQTAAALLDSLPATAVSLSARDVALILGRSVSSVWRDAAQGRIPAPVKTGPNCTRWQVGAIRQHLAKLGATAQ